MNRGPHIISDDASRLLAVDAVNAKAGWLPIETAPKDGTGIIIAAQGVQNTGWMMDFARWGCRTHCFSSRHEGCPTNKKCKMDWLLGMGQGYGVPVTHWMARPAPPVT